MSGVVRIAAPETITTHILLPALQPFLAQYRALELEFITGVRTVGIARGEADIALRLVPPEQGALTRRQVGTLSYGLYAAPGATTDLATARIVGWTGDFDLPADRWLKRLIGREPDIRTTQLEAQRAAITAGIGVGILPCFLAKGLIPIPTDFNMTETLWLVGHAQSTTQRIRRVYQEITAIVESASDSLKA
jgi:DNA-binding transcriptional LysR family regulator